MIQVQPIRYSDLLLVELIAKNLLKVSYHFSLYWKRRFTISYIYIYIHIGDARVYYMNVGCYVFRVFKLEFKTQLN